jgi:hypothetical protein
MMSPEELAADRADNERYARELERARSFLRRRQAGDGLAELEKAEDARRSRIVSRLQELCGTFEAGAWSDVEAAWSGRVRAAFDGNLGFGPMEEALGYLLFSAPSPGWPIVLNADGWRLLTRYTDELNKRRAERDELRPEVGPAVVAQAIANKAAPMVAEDWKRDDDRIDEAVSVFRKTRRGRQDPKRGGYEVFIDKGLGERLSCALEPSAAGDLVGYFLRDEAFMAALLDELAPRVAS